MNKLKKKIFNVIQIGNKEDFISRAFDYFIVFAIFLNLLVTILETYEEFTPYIGAIKLVELITILIFTLEYILRLWTADYLYPEKKKCAAVLGFVFSFYGLIDLLTILPYYLPFLLPFGAVAFRLFRVIRIFRLFKINSQYDAFNVITDVLKAKKNQLLSSLALILIFMTAASLCMYGLEHDAQPEAFRNAFSGIWWSVSTLLTVGYGDIYPVTALGRFMAIIIAFLGVGMVAIPTGIISAGFVEQYNKSKNDTDTQRELMSTNYGNTNISVEELFVTKSCPFLGLTPSEIPLPEDEILLMIKRGDETHLPSENITVCLNDKLIIFDNNNAL